MKRFLLSGLILLLMLCCSGCYWHLRNPQEVPPQLKVLYLRAETVDSHFNLHLVNLLRSMKIELAKTPGAAPLTLHAYKYRLWHNNPPVSSTNVAITYMYILTVTVSVTDAQGKIVLPPRAISVSRSVTIQTNQIFTINSTSVFQEELQREAINLIYYWLISDRAHRLLAHPPVQPRITANAIDSSATQPAP
jgi:LPS-assembly lipoprotein